MNYWRRTLNFVRGKEGRRGKLCLLLEMRVSFLVVRSSLFLPLSAHRDTDSLKRAVTHKPLQTFGTSALSLARSIPGISPPPVGGSQSVVGVDPISPSKGATKGSGNGNGKGMDAVDEWGYSILSDDD